MRRVQVNARYTDLVAGAEFVWRGVTYRVISNNPERWELTAQPNDGGAVVLFEYN